MWGRNRFTKESVMAFRSTVLSLAVLLLATAPLAMTQAGTYTTIDFPGAISTVANGIDTAGDIVGQFTDSSFDLHGFLLSGGVYTQLDVPGASHGTVAYGINDVGQVVGGVFDSTLGMWVYDIQTQTYTMYQYSNGYDTIGTGINNQGTVVGYTVDSSGRTIGLELKGSTFKVVRIPNAFSTQLTAINNSGAIIALATSTSQVKTSYVGQGGGTFKQIIVPGFPTAYAVAINDSNVLAGDYYNPDRLSAFEWQRKGLFKIINEPKNATYANGINSAGQVVGYYVNFSSNGQGFLWTPPADAGKK
jgi:uncharacterized membrane protein